jgi:cytochrome b6-f complex iron-sulfur subunit
MALSCCNFNEEKKMATAHAATHAAAVPAEALGTPLTRRELLNYVWLGSMGVFLAQLGGASILFALPRFKAGEFGGVFDLGDTSSLPATDAEPKAYNNGKFWLVNTPEGLLAIYCVCTHLGCLYAWQASQNKFICPCHGSQFERGGKYIQGPAPRSLDAFNVIIKDSAGNVVTDTKTAATSLEEGVRSYAPVTVSDGQFISVDTGDLISASGHEDGFTTEGLPA